MTARNFCCSTAPFPAFPSESLPPPRSHQVARAGRGTSRRSGWSGRWCPGGTPCFRRTLEGPSRESFATQKPFANIPGTGKACALPQAMSHAQDYYPDRCIEPHMPCFILPFSTCHFDTAHSATSLPRPLKLQLPVCGSSAFHDFSRIVEGLFYTYIYIYIYICICIYIYIMYIERYTGVGSNGLLAGCYPWPVWGQEKLINPHEANTGGGGQKLRKKAERDMRVLERLLPHLRRDLGTNCLWQDPVAEHVPTRGQP